MSRSVKSTLLLLLPGIFIITVGWSLVFSHDHIIDELTQVVPDGIFNSAENQIKKSLGKKNCLSAEQEKVIQGVFTRLGRNRHEYSFYLISSSEKNAFAMPGKTIVFNDGLIKDLSSLEAFAGVLAHEIAHIEKDHLKRQMVKSLLAKWIVFAVFGNEGAIIEGIISSRYNQAEEVEADQVAADMLAIAGIDPWPIGQFFEKKMSESSLTKYFALSHPSYEDRIRTFSRRKKSYIPMSLEGGDILKKGCQSNL